MVSAEENQEKISVCQRKIREGLHLVANHNSEIIGGILKGIDNLHQFRNGLSGHLFKEFVLVFKVVVESARGYACLRRDIVTRHPMKTTRGKEFSPAVDQTISGSCSGLGGHGYFFSVDHDYRVLLRPTQVEATEPSLPGLGEGL